MFDHKKQVKLNLKHRGDPQAGDYWQERMSIPILLVIDVGKFGVFFLEKTKDIDSRHWTWDINKVEALTFKQFARYLSYTSIHGKTWCDVIPDFHDWKHFTDRALKKGKRNT